MNYFILVFSLVAFLVESRMHSLEREYFIYSVSAKEYSDDGFLYLGMEYEFYTVRENITDSTLVQMRIYDIGNDSTVFIDTFKVVDNKWYIKSSGYYYKYLNMNDYNSGTSINIPINANSSYIYLPMKPQKDTTCIDFNEFVKTGESMENIRQVCFDPKYGITKIFIHNFSLILTSETNEDRINKLDKIFNSNM